MNYFMIAKGSDVKIPCGKSAPSYNSERRQWIAESLHIAAEPGDYQLVAEPEEIPGNFTPSPMQFMLMLTLAEQIAIRAAADTDAGVKILVTMLDDPRLTFVDLNDPTVIEAIKYLTTTKPALLTTERAARLLKGLGPVAASESAS